MFDMAEKVIWLAVCLLAYMLFCLACGYRGARAGKRSGSFFIIDGGLSAWTSASALTAACLGAWVFLAHPGLIYVGGLPAASLSSVAIALPLCALLVFSRLSALGLRSGKASIANLLGEYFQNTQVRNLVILAGLGFALPLLALQFRAAGVLVNMLSDDTVSINAAMLVLAGLVTVYVAWGGIRSVVAGAAAQFVLMSLGIALIGIVALYYMGGVAKFSAGLAALAEIDSNRSADNFSHYLAVPGVIQLISSAREALGSPWTGTMIATSLLAFTGIIVSPVFSNWALCVRSDKPAPPQMIWTSAALLGLVLLVFTLAQGLGGHLLGGNMAMTDGRGDFVYNVMGANLSGMDLMETEGQENELVPVLIYLLGDTLPWLFGLLTVCALAALNATSAALLVGSSTLLTRAGFGKNDDPTTSRLQAATVICILSAAALALAWAQEAPQFDLAHLALSIGAQMWPALLGLCWLPRINGRAVAAGMVFGIIAAFATEPFGVDALNIQAWGAWPLTVHSAFWGLLVNMVTVLVISAISPSPEGIAHREAYHQDRREAARDAAPQNGGSKSAAALALVWVVFAAGPGTVVGNTAFGSPNTPADWLFGIPSLWAWQALWWALGVAMLLYVSKSLKPSA
ncbi:MAG: hypothetical protein GY948_11150 [Alphaproteobacteria bacterium]|nr:hypothetical protein [Alphaproteobacteria bacterium]